jgi:hypothetical protein
MDHPESYKLIKRCPVCFSREIDVLMIPLDSETHRCAKCSFVGTNAEIQGHYRDIQKKYHWMGRRLTLDEQRSL